MPLPLTVSCFSKFQTAFIYLILAHPGSPGQRVVKRVYVHVSVEPCTALGSQHDRYQEPQTSLSVTQLLIHIRCPHPGYSKRQMSTRQTEARTNS